MKVWHADDLLSGLDELLNPSDAIRNSFHSLERSRLSFSSTDESMQHGCGGALPTGFWGRGNGHAPLYNPASPSSLAFRRHGNLIGDPFDEFLRLQGSFFLSYGVHICNENILKTRMLAKCGNVEKQAASPIAKYVPSLKKGSG